MSSESVLSAAHSSIRQDGPSPPVPFQFSFCHLTLWRLNIPAPHCRDFPSWKKPHRTRFYQDRNHNPVQGKQYLCLSEILSLHPCPNSLFPPKLKAKCFFPFRLGQSVQS